MLNNIKASYYQHFRNEIEKCNVNWNQTDCTFFVIFTSILKLCADTNVTHISVALTHFKDRALNDGDAPCTWGAFHSHVRSPKLGGPL